jgi:hypothetical protein
MELNGVWNSRNGTFVTVRDEAALKSDGDDGRPCQILRRAQAGSRICAIAREAAR